MASIRKLDPKDPKSPWVVEYTDAAGKRRRKTPKSGLKKDADEIRKQIEREMGDGVHVATSETVTVRDAAERFMRFQEERRTDGRIGYSRFLGIRQAVDNYIIPHFGARLVTSLSSKDVSTFYTFMRAKGIAAMTCRAYMFTLRMLEEYCIEQGFTKRKIVADGSKSLKGIERAPIATFGVEQIEKLIAAAEAEKGKMTERGHRKRQCFVHIAAFCGLRFGEIVALKVENVCLERRVIKVRHSMQANGEIKGPKTRAGVRDVPMPRHLAEMLRAWMRDHFKANGLNLVFSSRTLKGVSTSKTDHGSFAACAWIPLLKASGLLAEQRYHFHALRHFCASVWIAKGMPLTDVARLLGHAKFDMTLQTYAHPLMHVERQQEVIESVADGFASIALATAGATKMRHAQITH